MKEFIQKAYIDSDIEWFDTSNEQMSDKSMHSPRNFKPEKKQAKKPQHNHEFLQRLTNEHCMTIS